MVPDSDGTSSPVRRTNWPESVAVAHRRSQTARRSSPSFESWAGCSTSSRLAACPMCWAPWGPALPAGAPALPAGAPAPAPARARALNLIQAQGAFLRQLAHPEDHFDQAQPSGYLEPNVHAVEPGLVPAVALVHLEEQRLGRGNPSAVSAHQERDRLGEVVVSCPLRRGRSPARTPRVHATDAASRMGRCPCRDRRSIRCLDPRHRGARRFRFEAALGYLDVARRALPDRGARGRWHTDTLGGGSTGRTGRRARRGT